MYVSETNFRRAGRFAALLGLTVLGAGMMQANTLTITGSPAAVTCNTATGPGTAATITVKPGTALTTGQTLVVTLTTPGGGLVVTPSAPQTFTFASQTLTYSVNAAPGCAGNTTGATTLTFTPAAGTANTATVNDTVTSTTSALVASGVTITCVYTNPNSTPTWTPSPAQTVSVTSAATGGTPFTVDDNTNAPPSWLTVSSFSGGTATSTAATFTVAATPTGQSSGCGGFAVNTVHTFSLHLVNAPAPDKLVLITMQVVPPSPLTVSPAAPSLTYVKGSGVPGTAIVAVTSSPTGLYTSVNTATLPIWLTVSPIAGTAPLNITFSSTSICDTLAPGTYTATVYLQVSGYAPQPVNVSLLINNQAPKLSVSGGATQNITWTLGTPSPTTVITAVSSDSPIAYTATTGGILAPIIATGQQSGLAYSFGTEINISFNPLLFAAATPGSTLTGTVTLTWGSPVSAIVVTINVAVVSPGATLSSLSPASVPTAPAGQTFTVVLNGTGFVPSTLVSQKTKVGIVVGGTIVTDTNFAANVINPSNISLTITVPAVADANLPFAVTGTGGSVVIGICNPGGATCSIPTGQATLSIGSGPIVQAVTSASAFTEAAPGTLATTAGYDMVSIFGANFCSSGGTGCSSTQILYGNPDALTDRYPTSLTPDTGASPRNLTVTFYVHGTGGASLGSAPLLFATNSQINALVPAAVNADIGAGAVDIVVNFATTAPPSTETASATSVIVPVNIAATDPGVFTVGEDGQGVAAALNSITYAQITQANPGGMRSTGSNSDIVSLYVTGLGLPDSSASNTSGGSNVNVTDCIAATGSNSYESALQAASQVSPSLTNIDGALLQTSLIDPSRLPPCMATTGNGGTIPTVTIGGVAATAIDYAGFVEGTVAGLYQINVTLPSNVGSFTTSTGSTITNITTPVQLPVVVTAGGVASQAGVNIWVAPRLLVTAPTALSGTVGVAWANSNNVVVATQGSGNYLYALSSGLLPAGLTLSNAGVISGTPAANTGGSYIVTVTATDSSPVPVTGTVTFTVVVAADLFMTSSVSSPAGSAGSAIPTITRITATGGKVAYTYALGTVTPPNGGAASDITLNTTTGVVSVGASSVAGAYTVTVTAVDSTTGTPLTGSITFTITLS